MFPLELLGLRGPLGLGISNSYRASSFSLLDGVSLSDLGFLDSHEALALASRVTWEQMALASLMTAKHRALASRVTWEQMALASLMDLVALDSF